MPSGNKNQSYRKEPYAQGDAIFDSNRLSFGTVTDTVLPNNLIEVQIEAEGGKRVQCVYAGNPISQLLGFSLQFVPTQGTRVIVYQKDNREGYVLGCVPSSTGDPVGQENYLTPTDVKYKDLPHAQQKGVDLGSMFASHRPLQDILSGEVSLSNVAGVGLQLLRDLSILSAGDLAKVECFLMDDMVRIISENFSHITSFGDYQIKNDGGRLTVRWDGTNQEYEAWGNKFKSDSKAEITKGENRVDLDSEVEEGKEELRETGRWRFSQFIGHLGNFIHLFVTDPVNEVGKIAEHEIARSGRFKLHVNDDGSLLCQSVADIALEKVVRIPVPMEEFIAEDPEGDKMFEKTDEDFSEFLESWKNENDNTLFHTVYQLRDYARWFSNWYSLARFRQMKKDWWVPSEANTPKPERNTGNPDRNKATQGISDDMLFIEKYATIRIFRDASILLYDGDGSCINMSNRDITMSARRHVNIEGTEDVNIVAGRNINVKARKHIDLVASMGGILIKSKLWLQSLCTKGTVLFQGNYDPEDSSTHDTEARVIQDKSILFRGVNIATTCDDYLVEAKERFGILFKKFVAKPVVTSISNWLFDICERFQIKPRRIDINPNVGVYANRLYSKYIFGDEFERLTGNIRHGNHIRVLDPNDNPEITNTDNLRSVFTNRFSKFYWRPSETQEYYESLTQQKIRLEGLSSLQWDFNDDELDGPISTLNFPWPGNPETVRYYQYTPGSDSVPLHEPDPKGDSKDSGDGYSNEAPNLVDANYTFYFND